MGVDRVPRLYDDGILARPPTSASPVFTAARHKPKRVPTGCDDCGIDADFADYPAATPTTSTNRAVAAI